MITLSNNITEKKTTRKWKYQKQQQKQYSQENCQFHRIQCKQVCVCCGNFESSRLHVPPKGIMIERQKDTYMGTRATKSLKWKLMMENSNWIKSIFFSCVMMMMMMLSQEPGFSSTYHVSLPCTDASGGDIRIFSDNNLA